MIVVRATVYWDAVEGSARFQTEDSLSELLSELPGAEQRLAVIRLQTFVNSSLLPLFQELNLRRRVDAEVRDNFISRVRIASSEASDASMRFEVTVMTRSALDGEWRPGAPGAN